MIYQQYDVTLLTTNETYFNKTEPLNYIFIKIKYD